MYLVKSCYGEDHILSRKTIKLGTLYEYRDTELAHIADREEGISRFRLSLDEQVEVPKRWANAMLGGMIHFETDEPPPMLGKFFGHIENMHIVSTSADSVIFAQCNAKIERHAPNCFIYCMSAVRRVAAADGIFPAYDSSWAITRSKASLFAEHLRQMLHRTLLSLEKSGNSVLPEGVTVGELQIGCRHELVNYVPRDQHIQLHGAVSVDDFMQSIRDMSFVKPPSYAHELEYRFSYTLERDDLIIQPMVKSIILPAGDVLGLVV
ncbi:hypothetical protein [Pseudomonas oryzihabitans]|uniref:hypothetical protein n=1 Tax=Pseudomonas oryzihabitans TaxID=47885 RepID=UPI002420339B|nr:hypothetical protein [Pseudomonas oryzihabitans]